MFKKLYWDEDRIKRISGKEGMQTKLCGNLNMCIYRELEEVDKGKMGRGERNEKLLKRLISVQGTWTWSERG